MTNPAIPRFISEFPLRKEAGFVRASRYFVILAVIWMVATTWRLYPQFKDAVRVDGRVTTVEEYIADACGERVGPAVATCLAEARSDAQRLLRREQGKSIFLIEAPLLGYLLFYLPLRLLIDRFARRGSVGMAPRGDRRRRGL